ncbi:MAG: nucleoside deaminase [Fibrobacteres bacterium]|nr:nucleoside deaminase [Fibrobacterota bacterium]
MDPKLAESFMREAFREAEKAYEQNEVPVGAVITVDNKIIARGYNRTEGLIDPTAHAEIIALGAAADYLGAWKMEEASIFVTLEPCVMCIGAILNARIGNIYYAAKDPRLGSCGSRYDLVKENPYIRNAVAIGGIMAEESESLLKSFFVRLREQKAKLTNS